MTTETTKFKIAVIGLWHLGETYSVCLSELGHQVIGFDENKDAIFNLRSGRPPLPEPELEKLLKNNIAAGRLSFSESFEKIGGCEIIWLTFDTPVDNNDNVDLQPIFDFFANYNSYFKDNVLIVISSQVPVGACAAISKIICEARLNLNFSLAYVPENLQLGRAVESFFKPDRIVVGTASEEARQKIKMIFSGLKTNFLFMSAASAEMTKHALNAFLASSLCFIYDIADLCRACGADVMDVARALRADTRIGEKAYLDASIGFSGGTLARDLRILIKKGEEFKIKTPVISAVLEKNKFRPDLAILYLERSLGPLKDKKISVFGLTYKPGTSTLRRALSLEIISRLRKMGVQIDAYDPAADREELTRLGINFPGDPYLCAKGSQAAVFMTAWPEFKNLDFKRLKAQMAMPFVFFDTRNFFSGEEKELKEIGFLYLGIGR